MQGGVSRNGKRDGSYTAIFYRIDKKRLRDEHFINRLAAAAQGSDITHVELSLGHSQETVGAMPVMKNVLRIFNGGVAVMHPYHAHPRNTHCSHRPLSSQHRNWQNEKE